MIEGINNFFNMLLTHWKECLEGGFILTSIIIVVMGIAKKTVFNHIKNKNLRKVLLSFTSEILVLPATGIYFVINKISFKYYWYACAAIGMFLIAVYWFYENTLLRNLINNIGSKVVGYAIVKLCKTIVNSKRIDKLANLNTDESGVDKTDNVNEIGKFISDTLSEKDNNEELDKKKFNDLLNI